MKLKSSNLKQAIILLAVFMSAYLSYTYNFFNVASDVWFKNHQIDSEQLVLDGLLNSGDGARIPVLGRYTRPEIPNQSQFAHELYTNEKISGEFRQYKSQYGLQVKALSALRTFGVVEIGTLQSITAGLMSLVVAAMFALVRKAFSLTSAICFASVYVFSPWIVVFSRNLYWVSFTWFLPMLATFWLSAKAYKDIRQAGLMFAVLFFAYFLKSLCGYEYLTTIFLASCAPTVFYGINEKHSNKNIIKQILINFVALLVAFSSALFIHSNSIANDNESGLSHIVLTAKKRLYDDKPVETAKAVCAGDTAGDTECERATADSLLSNPFKVTAKYFVVPDLIPWISAYQAKQENKDSFKTFRNNFTISGLASFYKQTGMHGIIDVGVWGFLRLIYFSGLILLIGIIAIFFRYFPTGIKSAIAVSFLAPISWFFAAKGHSYIHYHINYVLWFVPFIPFCILALATLKPDKAGTSQ